MPSKLGLIIEDESDSTVIAELVRKLRPTAKFSIIPVHAGGCARIRAKAGSWSQNLAARGCNSILVVHDCDRHKESDLRKLLEAQIQACPIGAKSIIIPVEEIEAWLLADNRAIKSAMNLKREPKFVPNPQKIRNPKEHLEALVFALSNKEKRYVNTRHNGRIAEEIDLEQVRRCASFQHFEAFIAQNIR